MRVILASGVVLVFLALPYGLRSWILANSSPRTLAWFGAVTLTGIAASFIGLLGALIAPGSLPFALLPRALEICFDAVPRLLTHPLKHWPSIVAAVVLLFSFVRLLAASVLTARDARRASPPRTELPGERAALLRHLGFVPPRVRVLPVEEALAYTTGLVRPETVLSTGLLQALDEPQRTAVLAHEQAHAGRGHLPALYAARVISRAFGFMPGVRPCVRYLVTALEARADDAAASYVGDPLMVADALTAVVALGTPSPRAAAGMWSGEVTYRVRRLTRKTPTRRSPLVVGAVVLVTVASVLAQGFAWSAGRAALTRERVALAMHRTCHLPHPRDSAV